MADARRALALRPKEARSYLVLSFRFPEAERPNILRQGLRHARRTHLNRITLLQELARLLWYQGRFDALERSLRGILRERRKMRYWNRADRDYQELGSALEAQGKYVEAEKAYRRALPYRGFGASMARQDIVLTRIRGEDYRGAEQALKEFRRALPKEMVTMMRAALKVLQGEPASCPEPILTKVVGHGPFGNVGLFGFYAAVVMRGMGRTEESDAILRKYLEQTDGNPREWGVTNRWEAGWARKVLTTAARASEA